MQGVFAGGKKKALFFSSSLIQSSSVLLTLSHDFTETNVPLAVEVLCSHASYFVPKHSRRYCIQGTNLSKQAIVITHSERKGDGLL